CSERFFPFMAILVHSYVSPSFALYAFIIGLWRRQLCKDSPRTAMILYLMHYLSFSYLHFDIIEAC
ncbi:hypothetical protein BJ322DRAFT_1093167, partial [Thelephora terrestris]